MRTKYNRRACAREKRESIIPYQINNGSWATNGTYKTNGISGGEVVLAPNEVKSVEITFSFKNGNIICLFELANDWNNAKLFVSSSIVQS